MKISCLPVYTTKALNGACVTCKFVYYVTSLEDAATDLPELFACWHLDAHVNTETATLTVQPYMGWEYLMPVDDGGWPVVVAAIKETDSVAFQADPDLDRVVDAVVWDVVSVDTFRERYTFLQEGVS